MSQTYDAVIVGAGIIGLAIAWRAQQSGLYILVVDASRIGSASGVAAGMLAPVTEATFGEERLLDLNLESSRRYPSFLDELGMSSGTDIASASNGTVFVALDRDQKEELVRLFEFQSSLGLPVEWMGRQACRSIEECLHPSVQAGIFAKSDREADPRELMAALRTALSRGGETMRNGSKVRTILIHRGRARGVKLDDGEEIESSQVVIAAGCWSGRIEGIPQPIARSLRPVKGQILRLRPRKGEPSLTEHIVRTREVYVVPRRDGSLVVGATVEEQGFDLTVTAGSVFELLRAAGEVLPGIREFELAEASAGLRPGSADNAPLIGRAGIDGLILATGHYRNGILLAPVTADSVAALLSKGEVPHEIAAFTPERFFP